MTQFHDLPEEVVLKIFKYLSHSQLHNYISRVCLQWRRICQDKELYKFVTLDTKLSLDVIISTFQKFSIFVQSLVINGRTDTNQILKMVPSLTNLKELRMYPCSTHDKPRGQMGCEVNANLLSIILEKNCNLTALSMINSPTRPGYFKLSRNNLTELILKNAYYQRSVDENGFLLQHNLKILNLQGVIINKGILSQVISNNKNTLETLKLDVWEPRLSTNDRLMAAVGACHNIRCLVIRNLSFCHTSDEAIKCLKELPKLSNLKFCRLENISSSAFCGFFEKSHSEYLQSIHLSACEGLCGQVVKIIAENCPHLLKVTIHQPKATEELLIKSEGILYLVSKCTKIQFLDLRYMHISIGQALREIELYLPALREFKYCSNNRDDIIYYHSYLNLKNFNVLLEYNHHLDTYLHGTRIQIHDRL